MNNDNLIVIFYFTNLTAITSETIATTAINKYLNDLGSSKIAWIPNQIYLNVGCKPYLEVQGPKSLLPTVNSYPINFSSPTTHPSCPGAIK